MFKVNNIPSFDQSNALLKKQLNIENFLTDRFDRVVYLFALCHSKCSLLQLSVMMPGEKEQIMTCFEPLMK